MSIQLPAKTIAKLAEPFQPGTRHHAMVDLAMSLLGNGLSETATFAELRGKFDLDMSDREIENVVRWAKDKNPKPSTGHQNGAQWHPGRVNGHSTTIQPPQIVRTPLEQVEWWTSGDRVELDGLMRSSPVPIPMSANDACKMVLTGLYTEQEWLNIVCDYTMDGEKANPKGAGKTLRRDDWMDWIDNRGVPHSKAGAWLRPNPCSEEGSGAGGAITDADVMAFKYCLLESDSIPIPQQLALFSKLTIPVVSIMLSGGGSVHAWVRIAAVNKDQFKARVDKLFAALKPFGIDQANRNPSRLSRLPMARRTIQASGDGVQKLIWFNPSAPNLTDETLAQFIDGLQFPAIEEKPMQRIARKAAERYEWMMQNVGKLGVPVGIPQFDVEAGGLKPGQTTVVAGQTGGGKSTFGLHIVKSCLESGHGVLLFSLEMDSEEVFDLIMADIADVDRNKFNSGRFDDRDMKALVRKMGDASKMPLWIEDSALSGVEQIRVRTMQLKAANKIGLVVVDYVQFVNPGITKESREQQVAKISHELRALARETKLPFVVLSQLNDEGRIRESRVIAHNANIVMVVAIEKIQDQNQQWYDIVKVSIVKGRSVATGDHLLEFDRKMARLIPTPYKSPIENRDVPTARNASSDA